MIRQFTILILFFLLTGFTAGSEEKVFCDFESDSYGSWMVTGTAFGQAPAQGTLPHQMGVAGYLGKRLVNSYFQGDRSVGTLTSPSFKIEENFISFLIGGGGHNGTHIDLIVDGKAVRTARGPNLVDGGTEQLDWHSWDVTELKGKSAKILIVDNETGGWGHINIDQIVFGNKTKNSVPISRDILIEKDNLHLPVKTGGRKTWFRIASGNTFVTEIIVEPAEDASDISFYANLDVRPWKGKRLSFVAEKMNAESKFFELVRQSNTLADSESAYSEKYRPQIHFSPRRGWTNDPNGLVFYKGEYHLFFQHNPFGVRWNNMTWGHAVSTDLLHWQEGPDAILPDKLGTIFSGSAVVDWKNTSGFQKGVDPPIVCLYTHNGPSMRFGEPASQSVAYSTDGGKTFQKYAGNPVLPHIVGGNRDPKVFWFEPTKRWIMALYMDKEDYALFESKNLLNWTKICDIPKLGCSECPDMFELPVDGNVNVKKWVFWGGNGKYLIGTFDGKKFGRESAPLNMKWGGNDYAAQSYSDTPGRRIQFSWMNGGQYPDMPFNQQFSVPRELTLRSTPNGIRLNVLPVRELASLRKDYRHCEKIVLNSTKKEIALGNGECRDLEILLVPNKTKKINLALAGRQLELDLTKQTMTLDGITAPIVLMDGKLELRLVLDRMSIEVFANGGLSQIAKCFVPDGKSSTNSLTVESIEGTATIESLKSWTLESVWKKR